MEVVAPVAADGHFGKHGDVAAEFLERDIGAVATDDADILQAFGAQQNRPPARLIASTAPFKKPAGSGRMPSLVNRESTISAAGLMP